MNCNVLRQACQTSGILQWNVVILQFFSQQCWFLISKDCTDAQKWEKGKKKGETEIAFFGSTLAPTNIAQNRRTTQKMAEMAKTEEEKLETKI